MAFIHSCSLEKMGPSIVYPPKSLQFPYLDLLISIKHDLHHWLRGTTTANWTAPNDTSNAGRTSINQLVQHATELSARTPKASLPVVLWLGVVGDCW